MRFYSFLATVLASLALALPAQAGFVVITPNVGPVAAGSTGNFVDIVLTNTADAPVQSYSLTGFNVQLFISGLSGVTFTNVTEESPGYVFSSNNLGILAIPGPSMIDWNDLAISPVTVNVGDTFTVGRIFFDVASTALAGSYSLTINPMVTTFSDENFEPIPFRVSEGQLQISGGSNVAVTPEPTSMALAAIGALMGGVILRRSARRPNVHADDCSSLA